MMRLCHISEWSSMFSYWLASMIALKPNYSRRGVFVKQDGTRFEAVMSVQFTYDEDAVPETILTYFTPVNPGFSSLTANE